MKNINVLFLLSFGIVPILIGCNVFSFMDHPSNDAQLISAARACFDRADYVCAADYYNKLSPSESNVAVSETAFLRLSENDATMAAFITSFGTGATGSGVTKLAEAMFKNRGETKRLAVYNAFQMRNQITGNDTLKNLVGFLGAVALAAEIMAETADSDGILRKTNLAASANCQSAGACAGSATCDAPIGTLLAYSGGAAFDITTTTPSGSLTLGMLNSAIKEAYNALNAIGAGGGFSSTADSFSQFSDALLAANERCYRQQLLLQGFGE